MFGKRAMLVGLATAGLLVSVVAVASADPGSGFTSVLIGRGQTDQSFKVHQRKATTWWRRRTRWRPAVSRAGTRTQAQ